MQRILRQTLVAISLLFGMPHVALADLNQTTTLPNNTAINFDTGAIDSATTDFRWNGSTLTPQGNATAVLLYNDFPEAQIAFITSLQIQLTPGYSKNALTPAVGDLIGVKTNGNHTVRVLVKAKSSTSITLRFTTFGVAQTPGGGTGGAPTIALVQNNSGRIPEGLPNSGISPSGIFVVIGSGLADAGVPALQSSEGAGIPRTLNGATITVKVGGATVQPAIYYTSPTQLAGVLPANTPLGDGTLTVTYKGVASNAYAIHVVAAALGINTYNGNSGVATDAITGALLTYANSGKPSEIIVLWTTGLGADPADSDSVYTLSPHAVNTPLQIYVGGVQAAILYQGASTYPGVNQINLVIPAATPSGCWISLTAVAGGRLSNSATLPVNSTGGQCVDTVTGFSASQIAAGGTQSIRTGFVGLIQTDQPANSGRRITNSATAAFQRYTGVFTPSNSVSPGGCIVNDLTPVSTTDTTGLAPGAIQLTGPSNLSATLTQQLNIKGAYFTNLAAGAIPSSGGMFSFTAPAGPDVGAFTTNITFSNPLMTWTNQGAVASVDRTQSITVTWNGGNPGTYIFITGTSATQSGVAAGFTCMAPVDAHQFTVPAYILSALASGKWSRGAAELCVRPAQCVRTRHRLRGRRYRDYGELSVPVVRLPSLEARWTSGWGDLAPRTPSSASD